MELLRYLIGCCVRRELVDPSTGMISPFISRGQVSPFKVDEDTQKLSMPQKLCSGPYDLTIPL